jgi:hypothetical protein
MQNIITANTGHQPVQQTATLMTLLKLFIMAQQYKGNKQHNCTSTNNQPIKKQTVL